MKKISLFLILISSFITKEVFANPACVVCTVAIGASLSIARKIGVNDTVVAVWLGGVLALMGYWSIAWFNKKKWYFWGRDFILMALSLSIAGSIYIKTLTYTPRIIGGILYIDPFLFAVLMGAILYVFSQKLYAFLKEKNGNHAHFPFEKVVLPLAFLSLASIYLTYFTL